MGYLILTQLEQPGPVQYGYSKWGIPIPEQVIASEVMPDSRSTKFRQEYSFLLFS